MTLETLINEIRPKVGDQQARKFSNARIIELINEGLEELGKKANVKKKNIALPVAPYSRYITIPDDNFIKLQRVRHNKKDLMLFTYAEIDKRIGRWEERVGSTLEAIVYDLQNPKQLLLYPLLDETSTNYEAINDNNRGQVLIDIPNIPSDSLYGLVTSIEMDDLVTPVNVYNVEELESYQPIFSISDNFVIVEFIYYALPDKIAIDTEDLTQTIDLDDSYITTLEYYVAGTLLLDDNRNENIQKANIFLDKFNIELNENVGRNSNSYQAIDYPETYYRTGFNS